MQYEITDGAAIQFSRSFYTAIVDGLPVDAAVSDARKGIWLADPASLEWGTPVLHMRARDGRLFRISGPRRAPVAVGPGRAPETTGPAAPEPRTFPPEPAELEKEPILVAARPRTYCIRCGERLVEGFAFCTNCGAPVT
jgi:hypothetical protein